MQGSASGVMECWYTRAARLPVTVHKKNGITITLHTNTECHKAVCNSKETVSPSDVTHKHCITTTAEREKRKTKFIHPVTALLLQLFSGYRQALRGCSLFDYRHASWPIDYARKKTSTIYLPVAIQSLLYPVLLHWIISALQDAAQDKRSTTTLQHHS